MTDRAQFIPGSPAPVAMTNQLSENKPFMGRRGSNSPRITLTKSKDVPRASGGGLTVADSVIEVSNVGGRHDMIRSPSSSFSSARPSTSLSVLSAKSLADVHQTLREKCTDDGLTPPPRVVAVQDGHGHKVLTELVDPGAILSVSEMQNNLPSKYTPLKPINKKKSKR